MLTRFLELLHNSEGFSIGCSVSQHAHLFNMRTSLNALPSGYDFALKSNLVFVPLLTGRKV